MERERLSKKVRILDAAAELIGENCSAIHTLKVADIARHAGVGKGTVYEYFSSKEEILQKAICHRIRQQIEEKWMEVLSKGSFREALYCGMELVVSKMDFPSAWDFQMVALLDDDKSSETVQMEMKSFFEERMMLMCRQLLERGMAEGLFSPVSMESACQAVVQLFCGLKFIAYFSRKEDLRPQMDYGYEMLLKILRS